MLEQILWQKKIPISEFVIQAYVWDALYRKDRDIGRIIGRIIPRGLDFDGRDLSYLAKYIADVLDGFGRFYNPFVDKSMGPIRQRMGELHSAVLELVLKLEKSSVDPAWLPKHTYIILSQIQVHAAGILEDLNPGEAPLDGEMEAIDNSLESMIDTYEEIKEQIEDSLDSYRRSRLTLVRSDSKAQTLEDCIVQISIGGTEVWRRLLVRGDYRLQDLHGIIQVVLGWKNSRSYRFCLDKPLGAYGPHVPPQDRQKTLDPRMSLRELRGGNVVELLYEYGTAWLVKIMILPAKENPEEESVCCVAGANAAPPEAVEGPLRFKRFLSALGGGSETERTVALKELGHTFIPDFFDVQVCNRAIQASVFGGKRDARRDNAET
jgi:hypothetical protein